MPDNDLAKRIESLEHELAALKTRRLESREIALMDDSGRARATLTMGSGGPEIRMLDGDGAERLKLALTKDGPGITLADERGRTRAWLGFAKESLRIGFADEAGHSRAFFGVMRDSGPVARFYDEGQNVVWSVPGSSR